MSDRSEPSRRDRLIAVAIDMFTHYGVRRTSVEDIATEASIAKGSVYLEFCGKAELFRAAAEHLVREILAAADDAAASDGAVEDRITRRALREVLAALRSRARAPACARADRGEGRHAADVFRAADDRYAALVERTLASGEWQVSVPELAGVLLRTAHGTGYGTARFGAAAYRKRLALAVGLILSGVRKPRRATSLPKRATS
jgi:AcrR family transcriptional regulator